MQYRCKVTSASIAVELVTLLTLLNNVASWTITIVKWIARRTIPTLILSANRVRFAEACFTIECQACLAFRNASAFWTIAII